MYHANPEIFYRGREDTTIGFGSDMVSSLNNFFYCVTK
jgi:hypothetical protein